MKVMLTVSAHKNTNIPVNKRITDHEIRGFK